MIARQGCDICHKPFTKRGNRAYWTRNNAWSAESFVCGRRACQQAAKRVPDGVIYSSRPFTPAGMGREEG